MATQYTEFEIDQDLTDVQEFDGLGNAPPALPPGEYVFDVVNLIKKTSSTNNEMIVVTFEVAEGEHQGVKVDNNYSLVQAAIGRWKKLAMACGADLTKIRSSDIRGSRIRGTVVHNPGKQMTNPDGTVKVGADGNPLPPRIFANIGAERALEDDAAKAAEAAPPPPPVTRKAPPVRRA